MIRARSPWCDSGVFEGQRQAAGRAYRAFLGQARVRLFFFNGASGRAGNPNSVDRSGRPGCFGNIAPGHVGAIADALSSAIRSLPANVPVWPREPIGRWRRSYYGLLRCPVVQERGHHWTQAPAREARPRTLRFFVFIYRSSIRLDGAGRAGVWKNGATCA